MVHIDIYKCFMQQFSPAYHKHSSLNPSTIFLQIMRAIILDNGSVSGPFCVISSTSNLVSHLAVDPVHG